MQLVTCTRKASLVEREVQKVIDRMIKKLEKDRGEGADLFTECAIDLGALNTLYVSLEP